MLYIVRHTELRSPVGNI